MIPDKRLDELLAIWELLVQKTLPLVGEEVDLNKEYMDAVSCFKELKELRKENTSLKMRLDISQENLGEVMSENRINVEQNKLLREIRDLLELKGLYKKSEAQAMIKIDFWACLPVAMCL